MSIEILATGDALRYLEENAAKLGIDDPDRVTPDPVGLISRFVALGFANHGIAGAPGPIFNIVTRIFDPVHHTQQWIVDAAQIDLGLLRILSNLLLGIGAKSIEVKIREGTRHPIAYSMTQLASFPFPNAPSPADVSWKYTPPDQDDIVRNRSLRLVLAQPLAKVAMLQICDDLSHWAEVASRSGFCPPDEEPANAGAMPTFAYVLSSDTVAIDFEGVFKVDEACFSAIASYLYQLRDRGLAVSAVEIA